MTKKKIGITFRPVEPLSLGLAIKGEAATQKFYADQFNEDHEKLLLLCQHYNIKAGPGRFYQLALALARDFYPAPKKRGRKTKWTVEMKDELVFEIERLVKPDDPSHGVEWACRKLALREPWEAFLVSKECSNFGPDPAEALRQVYFGYRNVREEWEKMYLDTVRKSHPK